MSVLENNNPVYVGIGLDFETGGLKCKDSACTQIAVHAMRLDTFEIIDGYVAYISPYEKQLAKGRKKTLKTKGEMDDAPLMDYEDKALEYSGITMQMLESQGVDLQEVAESIIEFIKKNTLSKSRVAKPFLIGQNITFDIGFLQQMMVYTKLDKELAKVLAGYTDFYGNFQPCYVDTIDLGRLALSNDPSMSSYKLELMAEKLGIELDDAHDASADVIATLNVAIALANRMRTGSSDVDGVIHKAEKQRKHFKIYQ